MLVCVVAACGFPKLTDVAGDAGPVVDVGDAGPVVDAAPACGDGVQQADEVCDDGNTAEGDSCNAMCSAATCLVPVTHPTIAAILAAPQECATAYVYSGIYAENLTISTTVTLIGVGATPAIIDGHAAGSVVAVTGGVVVLDNLTLRNGRASTGGGLINHAALTLLHMRLEGNTAISAVGQGAGIYNDGNFLALTDTTVSGNHAATDASMMNSGASGAGLYSARGSVAVMGGSIDTNDITIAGLSGVTARGAGIAMAGGSLLINGAAVRANLINLDGHPGEASGSGGGIYVASDASLSLSGAIVIGNELRVNGLTATALGAAVFRDGDITATDTQIEDNRLNVDGDANTNAQGGGIYVTNASAVMLSTTSLKRNTIDVICSNPDSSGRSNGRGAGMVIDSQLANIVIDNSVISDNRVTASGGLGGLGVDLSLAMGGGLYWNTAFKTSSLTLRRTTIADNTADASTAIGGAIAATSFHGLHTFAITQCTVSGNRARGGAASFGGGVFLESAVDTTMSESMAASLSDSTVSGNAARTDAGSATGGGFALVMGGAFSGDVTIDIASSTFAANSAQGSSGSHGGGIALGSSSGTTTAIFRNTIVSGNIGATPDCTVLPISGGVNSLTSQGFNVFGATTGCTIGKLASDISSNNAMLGPLADNGGPTMTHALLLGSVALDAGNPAGCFDRFGAPLSQDQRGMQRVANGRCDIGAYEK